MRGGPAMTDRQQAEAARGLRAVESQDRSAAETEADPLGLAAAGQSDELRVAARGVGGPGQALPHAARLQAAFGHHDLGDVTAHVGGDAAVAAQALGAQAYATGRALAFAQPPDLHLAAHEAAHVVQQRPGVARKGEVGEVGDAHEQHADAVAEAVVRGDSAEALLDAAPTTAPAVQREVIRPAQIEDWYKQAHRDLDAYADGDGARSAQMVETLHGLAHVHHCGDLAPRVTNLLGRTQNLAVFAAAMDYFRAFYDAGEAVANDWLLHHYLADRWLEHGDQSTRALARDFALAHLTRWIEPQVMTRLRADAEREGSYAPQYTAAASAAVEAGLDAQEQAPGAENAPPVELGVTVLRDPATGDLLCVQPHTVTALVEALVVGGAATAAKGLVQIGGGGSFAAVDPVGSGARVVLPGERLRLRTGPEPEAGPLPLIGDGKGSDGGRDDQIKFMSAAAPFDEAARIWQAERAARQQQAEGNALSLSLDAADRGVPFAAYAVPVEVPGMAGARPLYVYDFVQSAYDTVVCHGDLRGADAEALRGAVLAASGSGAVPPVMGTRILTFERLSADEIDLWVAEVDAADRAKVEEKIAQTAQGDGTEGIAHLNPREIAQASPERRLEFVERIYTTTSAGDAQGQKLMLMVLGAMGGSEFGALITHLLNAGAMNTFGHWCNGDAKLMWLMGDQLLAAGITQPGDRNSPGVDGDGNPSNAKSGVMLWEGKNPTWGGGSKELTVAGHACTLQIGDKGVFGSVADAMRVVHGAWKEGTAPSRETMGGAFFSGVVDWLAESGIGTLDMLDRPAETAEALYLMVTNPGPAIDAMQKALGKEWDALIAAAGHGLSTGDWSSYSYLAGRWTATIVSTVSGVVSGAKGAMQLAGQIRKLGPRQIMMLLRSLLLRSGRVTRGKRVAGGAIAALRADAALMKRLSDGVDHLDALSGKLAAARKANAAAEATGAATAGLREAQALETQRAWLGRVMRDQGVVGADLLHADQLSVYMRAALNPDVAPHDLDKLRRALLVQNVPDLADLPSIQNPKALKQTPQDLGGLMGQEQKKLKKAKKDPVAQEAARKRMAAILELNDFYGANQLNADQMGILAGKLDPSAARRKVEPLNRLIETLRGLPDESVMTRAAGELQKTAAALEKNGLPDAAAMLRRWAAEPDMLSFGIEWDLENLANNLVKTLSERDLANARSTFNAMKFGLPPVQEKLTVPVAREALQRMFEHPDLFFSEGELAALATKRGQGKATPGQFLPAELVEKLPDEVVLRLVDQMRRGRIQEVRHQMMQVRVQGLKDSLRQMDEVAEVRGGSHGTIGSHQNIATAKVHIDGVEIDPHVIGVSGEQSPAGTIHAPPSGQRRFATKVIEGTDRLHDSEANILEAIAEKLGENRHAKGSIELFSERPCCPSCLYVIEQFRQRYPNVTLTVNAGL
ncbi:MAG: DUF4157 domain-containing protein [Myxococcales bacterium]|nr:DUF4157 domain-containing protein [Myxococcales bacterium]